MYELKRCPFCGELPSVFENERELQHKFVKTITIICCNRKCYIKPSVSWDETMSLTAIERWNTRNN